MMSDVHSADQTKVRDTMQLVPMKELKGPVHLPDETFDEYKKRRKVENLSTKHYFRGRIVWGGGTRVGAVPHVEKKTEEEADIDAQQEPDPDPAEES